ncbi:hypothetical protein AAHA92_02430 [Salvia divinorum]
MYPMDDAPYCCCGAGKMDLRCAGKSALHAGRLYLKCPVNGKHAESFIWFDEHNSQGTDRNSSVQLDKGKRVRDMRWSAMHDNVKGNGSCEHCCGNRTVNDLKANVLIGFTGILLVKLGVLIGKLM